MHTKVTHKSSRSLRAALEETNVENRCILHHVQKVGVSLLPAKWLRS